MIIDLIQTRKDLFKAEFIIKRGDNEVGEISLKGSIGSMEAVIQGRFDKRVFGMRHKRRNKFIVSKAFRPYLIKENDAEKGTVYQTTYKGGLLHSFEFHEMILEQNTYHLYGIALGKEGSKFPIYEGAKQTAQAEKDCIIYNDMHNYRIYADGEESAWIALLFCLYMYVNACYEPGKKVRKSVEKFISVTTNETLLQKYDPHFKDDIVQ